jgi:LPS sulfotransferase NodH
MKDLIKRKLGLYKAKNETIKVVNRCINKQNVAMLHTGRCGSTVLGSMLHQHKSMSWVGEPFEPYMQKEKKFKDFNEAINIQRGAKIAPVLLFAIKHLEQLHLNKHCLNINKKELVEALNEFKDIKFISLERNNYLKRAVSAEIARSKKQWHVKKGDSNSQKKVHINVENFQTGHTYQSLIELFDSMTESYQTLCNELPKGSTLYLTYEEDILENPLKAYYKVCQFLKLPEQKVRVNLKKTNPFPLSELIINYDEVYQYLEPTKYKWMLD